ncbi:helix-turn-helix domain-containing protein [Pseudoalteromonas spongiae]|uniref:helix-turn-helix domain-containing protein n=1 Tax=Pseudoalteromonas spongiae TaxID=298657 RepID=UPI000C2D67CF|nr:helix-turn-helix transcriptional regulator [Pseudoalteromonas spongiae]
MRGFEILRKARKFREYTQEEVAKLYGRSLRSYQRWEKGAVPIPYDDLRGIVTDTLGLSITQIEDMENNGHQKAA